MKNENMKKVKEILKKFKKCAVVESAEEEAVLDRYAPTGMVENLGFSETGKAEAKLSAQGRWFLRQL